MPISGPKVSVDTDEGRLRPDVIVSLPGGRKLVIDAKCSLNAYLDAWKRSTTTSARPSCAPTSRRSAPTPSSSARKAYWAQFGDAADYVVMYIPGEHFLTAALEQDDGLWEWAFETIFLSVAIFSTIFSALITCFSLLYLIE